MSCEIEWPTLIEANHIKTIKKKHTVKKKSSWIKIDPDQLFNKTQSNNCHGDDLIQNGSITNGKEIRKATFGLDGLNQKIRNKIIKPFSLKHDIYTYIDDHSLIDARQKTFCKKFSNESNITTTIDDIRVEEMYNQFLNEYLTNSNYQLLNNFQKEEDCEKPRKEFDETNRAVKKVDSEIPSGLDGELMLVRTNILGYYFSESNLCRDNYLIGLMDDNGWVDINILLKFPRLLKTKTTIDDILIISKNISYTRFKSINDDDVALPEAVIEICLENNDCKIRRSDMDNFRLNLVAFDNVEKYESRPYYSPYPDYTYHCFINSIENRFSHDNLISSQKVNQVDEGWKEVKPKSRRSRRSECKNENDAKVNDPDYLDFEFSSEPNPVKVISGSNLRRRPVSRKSAERSRSRTISCGSEDELDESNIYILSLKPSKACPKILNWADVSDSDEDMDYQIPLNSQTKPPNISQRLLAKHPGGDRHPNPDYQPRSKIQEQLREIIFDGLYEWKSNTEVIRRHRTDSSSSTSSDIKVTICQDEKAFKLMQKSIQNHDTVTNSEVPLLPIIVTPIEQKVEVMKQKTVNVIKLKPLPMENETTDYDFLLESSTSSLINPVNYDSWNPPYIIDKPLNELLDKMLSNIKYEYISYGKSEKTTNVKVKSTKKNDEDVVDCEAKTAKEAVEMVKSAPDALKEVRKTARSCKVGFYPVTKVGPAKNQLKDKTRASDHPIEECDVGYAFERRRPSKRHRTVSGSSHYNQYNDAGYAVAHGIPIPFNDHPSQVLLTQNGFEIKFYKVFRKESLADREKKGVGRSQEMNTLFRFWSFFLRENRSRAMYEDFQKYAWEDAAKGYRYGVECLFRMYTYKLEQKRYFSEEQCQDFQRHVLRDYDSGHLYGLEKFWAFLKYSCRKIEVNDQIKKLLEKFKTLEDFRINFIPPQGFHSYKIEQPEQAAVESGIESE